MISNALLPRRPGSDWQGLKKGKPFIDVKYGFIDVKSVTISGKLMEGGNISAEE